jgi:Helix-turn-helix domain
MTSEEVPPPGTIRARDPEEPSEPGEPGEPGDRSEATPREQGGDPQQDRGRLNLTDPKAIRALAHPVRWALLDALDQAGTLTATQASEMLGESPANCAFHLRTLAKYGYVEEAGGGRGRERPWRPSFDSLSWRSLQDDPEATRAAQALSQVWFDRTLARARHSLGSKATWPAALRDSLGASTTRLYLTPDEAIRLYDEVWEAYERLLGMGSPYLERKSPKLRPPDAVPVEFILLSYPLLDLPALPEGAGDDDEGDSETDPDG